MKAGRILKLAGQNYISQIPEHLREGLTKQLNVVLSTADTFNADLAVNEQNAELSPEGRSAASVRVAAAALATLQAIEATTIKTLTDRAVSLEKSLLGKVTYTPPTDPAKRIAHESQLQEIRSQLRELSASERLSTYLSTTDPLVLAAIETAPVGVLSAPRPDGSRRMEPFVDPKQIETARLERAERADPTTASTLREMKSLREIYSHAVNGVRSEILAEVPAAVAEREPVIV